MKTVVCPKCNQLVIVPEGKDFAICCGEVIYVTNEAHNRKVEQQD